MNNRFLLLLCSLMLTVGLTHAQTLPTFSADGADTWYVVQFKRGEAVLAHQGEGQNLTTTDVDKNNPAQLWKLVGGQNDFELISKSGMHVYYNTLRTGMGDRVYSRRGREIHEPMGRLRNGPRAGLVGCQRS